MQSRLKGVIIAVVTPFSEDLRVDREVLVEHAECLVKSGVDGVYLCGSTGQSPLLSLEEKLEVVRTVIENCSLKLGNVIVHIESLNVCNVLDFGYKLLKLDVKWLALQPSYYKYDEKAIKGYFKFIVENLD